MEKAKHTGARERNRRVAEQVAEEKSLPPIPEGTTPIRDGDVIVGYMIPELENGWDYGEGKTAQEEMEGQQVLAALVVLSAFIVVAVAIGLALWLGFA